MKRGITKDQRGLVSFMVTLIMMLVISLIVIGFTQVTNRNRREQLDRQLSMQAFYAAESGVNDAISQIKTALSSGGSVVAQDTCATSGTYAAKYLNPESTVGYTCVLVNPNVSEIVTTANTYTSSVIPINPVDVNGNSKQADSLSFTWGPASGVDVATINPTSCQLINQFPKNVGVTNDCAFGVLRVDLYNQEYSGGMSTPGLAGDTMSFYLQPLRSGGGSSPSINKLNDPAERALVVGAAYDATTHTYSATLNLTGNAMSRHYYARITTLYKDSTRVVVDGTYVAGNIDSYFAGAQAQVDVTGKAQDILRRVQVTVPLEQFDGAFIPEGAVQSGATVCKKFSTYDGYYSPGC